MVVRIKFRDVKYAPAFPLNTVFGPFNRIAKTKREQKEKFGRRKREKEKKG